MNGKHIVQPARKAPTWASTALTAMLLALGLCLLAGLAHAQSGSISGSVTYQGGITGTHEIAVGARQGDPDGPRVAGIRILGPGSYTLSSLEDGTYYVGVHLDANDSGGPPADWEPIGWYDPDRDGLPDPVVISGGAAVTGIDIAMGGPWLPLGGPAAEGGQVNALAVHPAIPGTVYAAVAPVDAYDSGPSTVYKTTNGAASWTRVYTTEHQVYSLAVTGTHVYAGAFNPDNEGPSIYASHDSGMTWAPVFSTTDRGVWIDISLHPTDPDVAIVGGWHYHQAGDQWVQSGLVYKTVDGGVTWTPVLTVTYPDVEGQVNVVMIHPVTPTLLLASAKPDNSADSFIYRSQDGGATWPVSFTINGAHVMSLVANASDPQVLYAGTGHSQWTWGPSKVFRSTDAGLTWMEVSSDTGDLLVFEPPSTVYAGPDPLWASTANGAPGTWTEVEGFWPGPQISFDIDLGTVPATLYVGGGWSGVSKGTDGGTNWTGANNGIETLVTPMDIAVDPQNLDKLFVAAECEAGWMTADGGATWVMPSGVNDCVLSFAVNPLDPSTVYAGAVNPSRGAVRRSEDGGLTFTPVYTAPYQLPGGAGGQQGILDLVIAPSMPDTVYAAGYGLPGWQDYRAVILRSLDDGDSWTEVFTLPPRSSVHILAIHPADEDVVYAGGADCSGTSGSGCVGFLYATTDGGENWELKLVTNRTIRSIVVDRWNPVVLYLSDDGSAIYKSTNGGEDWDTVLTCCPSGYLLAIDPNVPSHVYLGGRGYIAETTDGGATWSDWESPLNIGTPEMHPGALAVDHGTVTQTLYAGFTGLWAHSRLAPQPTRVYLPLVLKNR